MLLSQQPQQHQQLYHKNDENLASENGYFCCLIDNNNFNLDNCIISIPLVINCELLININNKNGKITLKVRLYNHINNNSRPPATSTTTTTTTRKRTHVNRRASPTSTSVSNTNFTLLTDRQFLIKDFNSILNGTKLRFKLESDSVKAAASDIGENLEKFSFITNNNKLNNTQFFVENEFNLIMNNNDNNNNNLSNLIDGKLIIELKDHNDNLLHKFDELLFEKLIKSTNTRKKKSKTNNNNLLINNNEKFVNYNEDDDETDGHVVGMKRCRLELFQQHQNNTHEIHEHFINKLKQHRQEHVHQQQQEQQEQQFAELINLNLFDQELFTINLNESHLWCITEIYENLGEWKIIGKQLSLNEQELLIIETKYFLIDGLKECFYQMLMKWRVKEPENCNLAYFLQIIIRVIHIHNLDNKNLGKLLSNLMHSIKYSSPQSGLNIEQQKQSIQRLQIYLNKYVKSNEMQEKLLNLQLSEKHLWNASNYIFQEWKSLARLLELTENDIIQIESKYYFKDGIRECCYQTLLKWREIHSTQCLFNILCLKLINKSFNLYVCQLIEYFSTIIQF